MSNMNTRSDVERGYSWYSREQRSTETFFSYMEENRNTFIIHTYRIGRYNPSVWIIDIVSHTTYGVRVNFIYGGKYSFEKLFHGIFIYYQSFWQKSTERKSPKKFFPILFWWWWGPGARTLALRLISQLTTY